MLRKSDAANELVKMEAIERQILTIRDQRVMLSHDLAALYGVETRALLQAVRRNIARFPLDFMFQLSAQELAVLRSQFVTSSAIATVPTPSRKRAWRCSPAFCAASRP
jgi:hypothetical protein